jgi:hypothetical protein
VWAYGGDAVEQRVEAGPMSGGPCPNHVGLGGTRCRGGQRLARPNASKCAWRDGSHKSREESLALADAVSWLQCDVLCQQLSQKSASTDLSASGPDSTPMNVCARVNAGSLPQTANRAHSPPCCASVHELTAHYSGRRARPYRVCRGAHPRALVTSISNPPRPTPPPPRPPPPRRPLSPRHSFIAVSALAAANQDMPAPAPLAHLLSAATP